MPHLRPSRRAFALTASTLALIAALSRPATGLGAVGPAGCSGSWKVVDHPVVGSVEYLEGVAATGPSDVWVVGSHRGGPNNQDRTLIEHWDGTSWTVTSSPSLSRWTFLTDVSALSPTDVWAVGINGTATFERTAVLHWDGSSWTIVPSPNLGRFDNTLSGVVAVSSDDVWAVGHQSSTRGGTLIEHWDGTAWTIVRSENHAGNANFLTDVTAVSSTDAWAVGSYVPIGQSGPVHTLVEHWDGASWSIVPSANPHWRHNARLASVSAVSTGDVWSVGDYEPEPYALGSLGEHWDGASWSIVDSPSPTTDTTLAEVSADSATDAWAVGWDFVGIFPQTLAERWDGTSWSVVPTPSRPNATFLTGVTAIGSNEAWAVGYGFGGQHETVSLIEHYC